jgi:DNA invertase Pin-like site-specific DNA recombinase
VSGSVSYLKRKLNEIIEKCAFGDYIIVQELSRLSRSSRDILNIRHMPSQKHITFHVVKENITWSAIIGIDTSDSNVKTLLYGMIGELEKDKISQRVKTGIYNARKNESEYHELLSRREKTLNMYFQGKKRVEIAQALEITKNEVVGHLAHHRKSAVIGEET